MQNAWPFHPVSVTGNLARFIRVAVTVAAVILALGTRAGAGIESQHQLAALLSQTPAPHLVKHDNIKKGMTVVCVKRNGLQVAHSAIGETRGGYLVQGTNNDEADVEFVNENNLIGGGVHAYASAHTNFRSGLTQQIAAEDRASPSGKSST
jgi:hypothetical protein